MTIKQGDKIPAVTVKALGENGLDEIDTGALFAGKKVALFSVPGAYTPTCSAKHLPSFVQNVAALKAKGIDEIICTSVNDPFVMKAWGKDQGVEGKVTMLPDGNADFVKALGLNFDGGGFGMGTRGQRFSMVVNNGVVEKLYIEEPGAYQVSSAEHMLDNL
ncbi:MAG: peroxiredoxin [Rhodospirillales bacterium]|nr:peroxiredoxin [Rhodospirillales bacterium]MCW8863218.1 peroxiredoxin [Rhodospirillales bacterium]MCW8953230.1 peroxiredoxin [Rhodospirillales bacterium]MCW8969862.1 peroxiredoxin [Rhodospirillales bacterium]MCW9001556.1 peroxiredoxin [Rhodospirillales bacterium]